MDKLEKFSLVLKKFIPDGFETHLAKLILQGQVKFKIVKGRKTKLGDFRVSSQQEIPTITVNGDLNCYSFLITALHELAHLYTFRSFGFHILPHGPEWKNEFRSLLIPIIDSGKLPDEIKIALMKSLVNTKASSCSDIQLTRVLRKYDNLTNQVVISLEDLSEGDTFEINGKKFVKGKLRRSRYLCQEVGTEKPYLIHKLAQIINHTNE